MSKPRVVKDFDKIDESVQEQIKLTYPYGFERSLITFKNIEGKFVSALPFETDEKYYLIRMTKAEAREIIEDDDDYTDEGKLKKSVKAEYEEKYEDDEDEDLDMDDDAEVIESIPDADYDEDDED